MRASLPRKVTIFCFLIVLGGAPRSLQAQYYSPDGAHIDMNLARTQRMSMPIQNTQECGSDKDVQTINLSAIPINQPFVSTVTQMPTPLSDIIPSSADVSTFNLYGD